MSTTIPTFGPAAPTLAALRGHRFVEGEGGAAPAAQPGGAGTPAGASESAPAGSTPTPTPPAGSTPPPAPAPTPETVESLPEWAQREIRAARKEAGDNRVGKRTVEQEFAAFKDEVAVKLGLKQPAAAPDPALTAAQTAAKQAAIDLAVYRTAATTGVNADRLLDSASFLANVRALDHAAADFPAQIAAAITAATSADPSLKAARAAGSSGPDTPTTTGEQGQISEADLAKASPEQIVEWDDKGLLKHLY